MDEPRRIDIENPNDRELLLRFEREKAAANGEGLKATLAEVSRPTQADIRLSVSANVLAAFAANPSVFAPNSSSGWGLVNADPKSLATYAIELADALLAELAKDRP